MTVLVAARPAWPDEIPSAAHKRGILASSHGWVTYRCTYAKAEIDGQKGPKLVESIALGFRRGDQRVVIVYEDGGFRSSWHLDDVDGRLTWVPSSRDIDSILKGASS